MANETDRSDQRSAVSDVEGWLGLADDDLYRVLTSRQRRRLLYLLLATDEEGGDDEERGPRAVDDLATTLVGWAVGEAGGLGTPADREEVLVALEHNHLPLLADVGAIAYDREDGTVEVRPTAPAVADLIGRSVDAERADQS